MAVVRKPADRPAVAASLNCDQLVVGPTHARGGILDLLMTDVPVNRNLAEIQEWCNH